MTKHFINNVKKLFSNKENKKCWNSYLLHDCDLPMGHSGEHANGSITWVNNNDTDDVDFLDEIISLHESKLNTRKFMRDYNG